ncbi:MAG TPA: fumarylacetoacetate hydrolase family protein [Jatrophihabitantaceae bacterium]
MRIARLRLADGSTRVGLSGPRDRYLRLGTTIGELLALTADEFRAALTSSAPRPGLARDAELVAHIDGRTEVWAAGVTYRRSRDERMAESDQSADVYDRVYDAERPEVFFKSVAWRVVGTGRPIAVRADSAVNVPEPELAVVVNRHAEVVGYTICNDVSSRSIEGENPLYLPQAKAYLGSCALGPSITPAWEVDDPYDLGMQLTIERDGDVAWQGEASTSDLHRRIDELVGYLFRADEFPNGVVLSTGTSLVPELPFTLQPGDVVRIALDGLGELSNPVVVGKEAMQWLL